MPFIKLADNHSCQPPETRDDGSKLVIGDEWRCDATLTDGSGRTCNRTWRYSDSQREGKYWSPITHKTPRR